MAQEESMRTRILARQVAEELTRKQLQEVRGGGHVYLPINGIDCLYKPAYGLLFCGNITYDLIEEQSLDDEHPGDDTPADL